MAGACIWSDRCLTEPYSGLSRPPLAAFPRGLHPEGWLPAAVLRSPIHNRLHAKGAEWKVTWAVLSVSVAIHRTQADREGEVCRFFESDLHRDFLRWWSCLCPLGLIMIQKADQLSWDWPMIWLGLEFGVASRYFGKAYASEAPVRAPGEKESTFSSTGFASAE